MIQTSGEQQLLASAEIVRERLRQMHWLVSQMPNLARVELVAENQACFVVRPGFSFLRGEMTVQLERIGEPDGLAWRMAVRGIASSAKATVQCSVVETGPHSCRLQYQVVIEELGGLLRTLHRSLLQAAVEKTVHDFLANLHRSFASPTDSGN